jgi:hypothetical protein
MVGRWAIAGSAAAVKLAAQDQSGFAPSSTSIGREALIGLAAGLVWYGSWKLLMHLLQCEGASRRRTLRYLVPTAMLAGTWAVLLALSASGWPTVGLVALLLNGTVFLFALADAPALFLSGGLLNLTVVAGLPPLYQGLLGSVAAWLVWFGIIRFFEWRREVNAGVSLRIT